jgi:hypothetical protein
MWCWHLSQPWTPTYLLKRELFSTTFYNVPRKENTYMSFYDVQRKELFYEIPFLRYGRVASTIKC